MAGRPLLVVAPNGAPVSAEGASKQRATQGRYGRPPVARGLSEETERCGEVLLTKRRAACLTQKELAEKADVSGNWVSKLERGAARMKPEMAAKLAPHLNCEAEDLLPSD